MERISKAPDERKKEIISTAQQLFIQKGYNKTKVSDIVKAIGVSQGIFYYYYSSKEDIIDEIVNQYIALQIEEARNIIKEDDLSPLEKLEQMAHAQLKINQRMNQNIHMIKGVDIHEKIISRLITDYVPLMVEAFGSPADEEIKFKFETFVASANILFDPGLFAWTPQERNRRIDFMIDLMERNLNIARGSFKFYRGLMRYSE